MSRFPIIRLVATLAALLLGLVGGAYAALSIGVARGGEGPPPLATAYITYDPALLRPTVPSLTSEQQKQIIDLALGSPHVAGLLMGQAPKATKVEVWTKQRPEDGSAGPELLGGVVTLTLPQPAGLGGDWLALAYDCRPAAQRLGAIPYGRVPYRGHYSNVSSLLVFVDLQRREVAGMMPDPDARREGLPEFAPGVSLPASTCGED